MKSKKQLFAALDRFFGTDNYTKLGLDAAGVGNETYGQESMIYVEAPTVEQRKALERELGSQGFCVNSEYWPGSATAEVQVSYFRGDGWFK
jgi:hypothetical protein